MFLRRRVSPCFIVLALSVRALFAATAPGAIELAAPGVALRADRWDRITINTPKATPFSPSTALPSDGVPRLLPTAAPFAN